MSLPDVLSHSFVPTGAKRHFKHQAPGMGSFSIRPLSLEQDVAQLHQWLTAPRASFWGMQTCTLQQVQDTYQQQLDSRHSAPFMGLFEGRPCFLLETYDPAHDELGSQYLVQEGDVGMHFLVGPAQGAPLSGFTRAVMGCIQAFLFTAPANKRIVVEPDVNNQKIHPINRDAGFVYHGTVSLSYKTAALAFCDRSAFFTLEK